MARDRLGAAVAADDPQGSYRRKSTRKQDVSLRGRTMARPHVIAAARGGGSRAVCDMAQAAPNGRLGKGSHGSHMCTVSTAVSSWICDPYHLPCLELCGPRSPSGISGTPVAHCGRRQSPAVPALTILPQTAGRREWMLRSNRKQSRSERPFNRFPIHIGSQRGPHPGSAPPGLIRPPFRALTVSPREGRRWTGSPEPRERF